MGQLSHLKNFPVLEYVNNTCAQLQMRALLNSGTDLFYFRTV
jgi:hypothetical protein